MKEFCHIIKKKHEWQVKQESRLANLVHVQDVTEPEGQGHVRRNPARRPLKNICFRLQFNFGWKVLRNQDEEAIRGLLRGRIKSLNCQLMVGLVSFKPCKSSLRHATGYVQRNAAVRPRKAPLQLSRQGKCWF
jgi:hypothetical protein